LAEVLITLAIIGVIAAITIPSIVANHQKKALETQFAKVYRTLSQAINMAVAEHGDMMSWDWKASYSTEEGNEFVKKYFVPYLNVGKFCPKGSADDLCYDPKAKYKELDGGSGFQLFHSYYPTLLLQDGAVIKVMFHDCINTNGQCIQFQVDTNGTYKKPNTIGRDVFALYVYQRTGEFLPYYINDRYNEETNSYAKLDYETISKGCTGGSGWSCGAKILLDGFKMNY